MTLDTPNHQNSSNPFLALNYEPAFESLGDDYYDLVTPAEFPQHILRFRNDALLPNLGLDLKKVTDDHFIETFGKFQGMRPFLAMRYHGYQFGEYNAFLGDGRGFLYGQVRGTDGELYDFGTKGSGTTPYSRGGDGRLTLKGGVREVLAAEALHQMGVRTSRSLSLIETGEALWRGDEPSPTRSSVMVRFNRSHIRFGTFERLHHIGRKDFMQKLLNHVVEYYYPSLQAEAEPYPLFYAELVKRVAELAAQWMAAGFCHGVLNTDNMSIAGESFDYGPYAFIDKYNPNFTAAYFDCYGRYSYGNQPLICKLNLQMLQVPLKAVISENDMEAGLAQFDEHYHSNYQQLMLRKLGLESLRSPETEVLLELTLSILQETELEYHDFFAELTHLFNRHSPEDVSSLFSDPDFLQYVGKSDYLENWCSIYARILTNLSRDERARIPQLMVRWNPKTVLLRRRIEAIWRPIVMEDDWEPFYELIRQIQAGE
jgi:serine/tyrosine/threonine adenylyltransferase